VHHPLDGLNVRGAGNKSAGGRADLKAVAGALKMPLCRIWKIFYF
jgi:hypothetical protein